MDTAEITIHDPGLEIADALMSAGVLDREQLAYAQRIRAKLGKPRPLTALLCELEYVSEQQLRETLIANRLELRLGSLLHELGVIDERDLQTAVGLHKESKGQKLGEILVENNFVSEDELLNVLSVQLGFPYMDVDRLVLDKRLLAKVRPTWLQKRSCFPVRDESGELLLAMAKPDSRDTLSEAEKIFGEPVHPCLARRHAIEAAVRNLMTPVETGHGDESEAVRTVNELLHEAATRGASDIHIEPLKDKIRIRMRQDGVLVQNRELSLDAARPLSSRIKILAGADIAEKRRHQGGRLLFEHEGSTIDSRVSFYSTIHGEKIVLRLLNNRNTLLDITQLGLAPRMAERFREDVLDVPSGVVLVTGPTGSGKTTTLYGAVNHLNNVNTSIITAEDPVEYVIEGISQCSINAKIGITYEETLRHIVRQDPDVIVIGEVRDRFSADTAIQAALTGHKVLTTFHTEDSIGGLLRLLHMDIEAFLISSTVVSVVAQRLVRRVCPDCRQDHVLTSDEVRRLGYVPKDVDRIAFARGEGCPRCHYLGYRGRIAVFELLVLNEPVKEALIQRRTSYEIRRISIETTSMVSLLEDGIVKATQGLTSFEEIVRTLPRLAHPRPVPELRRLLGVRS